MINERLKQQQNESLKKRKQILAYVEEHQPVSSTTIARHFALGRDTASKYLQSMRSDGHLIIKRVKINATVTNMWFRGANNDPIARVCEFKKALKQEDIERGVVISKAVQIGMRRGELETYLFGPAQAAA